ncbi:MAG TPA: hypothetical protein HA254_06560 [Candidatus Diapherotrites archaeon]|uniref:50S ribosomal protein L34e n=1 Tax=Candidatus Iainarchaeum sp. TaxID=3101447 RepID=A0A7J4J2K9_9ARCH|nr:hypothetical protein [Candidatus Diapherotrites archaeon]
MVDRQTRVKKKKFRKTPGGKTAIHYSRAKRSYATCNVSGKKLAGTGNQSKSAVSKSPKSSRRPNVKFGGVLASPARTEVWENAALIIAGKMGINDVPSKSRKFVAEALR